MKNLNIYIIICMFINYNICQSQNKYLPISSLEKSNLKNTSIKIPYSQDIDLWQNPEQSFETKIDSESSISYEYKADSYYSIKLKSNGKIFLLDSLFTANKKLKQSFQNGNYFVYIKKIHLGGHDFYYLAYGARSHNSTTVSSFIPIVIDIIENKIEIFDLDGFIYDTNNNLIISTKNNVLSFFTLNLDEKKIWITKLKGKKSVQEFKMNSLIFDSNKKVILISKYDLKNIDKNI